MKRVAIGARLREARNQCKLTQEQLAEMLDIGTTYISDIERGAKFPSLSLFIKIVSVVFFSTLISKNVSIFIASTKPLV